MNKEFKKEWITALRSNKYVQGKGALKIRATDTEPAKYCCLGLACELLKDYDVLKETEEAINAPDDCAGFSAITGVSHQEGKVLPLAASKYMELEGNAYNPTVNVSEEVAEKYKVSPLRGKVSLAELNDAGMSFNEIADLIEEQL